MSVLTASIVSVFFAIFIPSIGQHSFTDSAYPGAWKGIFSHKNGLGVNLTITCVLSGIKLIYENRKKNTANLFIYLIICVEIVFSKSLSSLLFSQIILGIIWMYGRFEWRGKVSALIVYCLGLTSVGVGVVINAIWAPLMTSLGRDPTLSARTLIWDYILQEHVARQPLLGYGRGSLWNDPNFYAGLHRASHHLPTTAHNGYVDLLLDLGYVGLLFFIISLLPLLLRTLKLAYKTSNKEDVMPFAIVIIILISNYTESVLLRGESFLWLLYFTVSCLSYRRYYDQNNFLDKQKGV